MTGDFAFGGRHEVKITPFDVGRRVSVRRITKVTDGRPTFADAVGDLISWDTGVLTVSLRGGEQVRIAEAAVVAGRTVPPPPARRRGMARTTSLQLQQIAARGWPAPESERLGEWTLRAAGGFTRRANSVLPGGGPGLPLDEALAFTVSWYAERALPALIQVTAEAPGEGKGLASDLAARGWTAEAHTTVLTAPLLPLADTAARTPEAGRVCLADRPDQAWLSCYRRTGTPGVQASQVLGGGPSVWFAAVPGPDGEPVAIGRCVVDGQWSGFAAVEVAPEQRRRGLATAVMAALAERAAREGADSAYLQVEDDNTAAAALYRKMGFTSHHGYHYRRAPQTAGKAVPLT